MAGFGDFEAGPRMCDRRPVNERLQTWNDGDDRGIDDAQVLGAVHPQLIVHDCTLPDI